MLAALLLVASCLPVLAHDPRPPPRQVRLRALLDGSQVVRPAEFQPPTHDSGSLAVGEMDLVVDTNTGAFDFSLEVEGILPEDFDLAHGVNLTAIHIHLGDPAANGPIIFDVHQNALWLVPEPNGVVETDDGFRMEVSDVISPEQLLQTGYQLFEVIDFLRTEKAYIDVHTLNSALAGHGEIRGNLRVVPETIRLEASLDESQVVRPTDFQPPTHGTGSRAVGEAHLKVNTLNGYFTFDLGVEGIDPVTLDSSHGENQTAVHIRMGGPDSSGPILLDLHHFARASQPQIDGIRATERGFHLNAEGVLDQVQGNLDTGLPLARIVDALQSEEVYIDIHSSVSDLSRHGEIRGNLKIVPDTLRFTASLDESQVVRPAEFQPPEFGTGSAARGEANLVIDKNTGRFSLELDAEGIDLAVLDNSHGKNGTAIQIHWGPPDTLGPIILDVQHFARQSLPGAAGVVATENGFTLRADGHFTRMQGAHDTFFNLDQVVNFLRNEDTYISVSTTTSELFMAGEIRGNLKRDPQTPEPELLRFEARLDGSQVVRPPSFQPPLLGTESTSVGDAALTVNTRTKVFQFEMEVEGVKVGELDDNQGANHNGIQIHKGTPNALGPILLDVHYFALKNVPGLNAITETDNGFRMIASGMIMQAQGLHDTGFSVHEIVDFLRAEEAYIDVHSKKSELFVTGEIRGNFKVASFTSPFEKKFVRGDCDGDGTATGSVTDAIFLLTYNFLGGAEPPCFAACDVDGDGQVAGVLTDAIYHLTFNFLSGPPPVPPFPGCGGFVDARDLALGCDDSPAGCR